MQTKRNQEILPESTYTGTNVAYITTGSNVLGSFHIDHPELGELSFAVSNDLDPIFANKTWIPIQVKPQGGTLAPIIDFTLTGADPVGVNSPCNGFAFMRLTLTNANGIYRIIYNAPFAVNNKRGI